MEKFAPRKYFGNTIIFYILFGIFWFIGLVFLLGFFNNIGKVSDFSLPSFSSLTFQQNLGIYFIIFSLFVILIMLFVNLAIGTYYIVDDKGITVSKNFYKKLIPYNITSKLKKINAEDVMKVAKSLRQDQVVSATSLLIDRTLKSSFEFMDLIRYCSVPITFTETRLRPGRIKYWVKNLKASTSGDFILLTLTNNKKHLLSPKDVDRFLNRVSIYKKI